MVASRPEWTVRARRLGILLSWVGLGASPALLSGQVEARPVLSGTAFVGDSVLREGIVILHHLSDGVQGELDSLRLGEDGRFAFPLPNVPDPARSDIFFASILHDDVLYFGPAITTAVELDSIYEIRAYDSIVAPADGAPIAMQLRSVFFEPMGQAWRVTDVFQLRNDEDGTFVARDGGRTWGYPLPAEARNVSAGEGEMSVDAASVEDGSVVVRAALPPGLRLFVVRYDVETPYISIPTPGLTETFDVLVREPAPPVEVPGFALIERVELEAGSTYRRFAAENVTDAAVELIESEQAGPPPVEWVAVVLAFVLVISGLVAVRPGSRQQAVVVSGPGRQELLVQIARLDESFESEGSPSAAARRRYEKRRAQLLTRLKAEG